MDFFLLHLICIKYDIIKKIFKLQWDAFVIFFPKKLEPNNNLKIDFLKIFSFVNFYIIC